MRTNDDQLYELYQKIYAIVEVAEFELDERFYHKPVAPKVQP